MIAMKELCNRKGEDTMIEKLFDDKLLSEIDGRVAVSRDLLAKSIFSKEIKTDLDGLFVLMVTLKNQILSERRACDVGKWTTTKPDFPCVVVTRTKYKERWNYQLWILEMVAGEDTDTQQFYYLGWLDRDGEEQGALGELLADEYLIISRDEQ